MKTKMHIISNNHATREEQETLLTLITGHNDEPLTKSLLDDLSHTSEPGMHGSWSPDKPTLIVSVGMSKKRMPSARAILWLTGRAGLWLHRNMLELLKLCILHKEDGSMSVVVSDMEVGGPVLNATAGRVCKFVDNSGLVILGLPWLLQDLPGSVSQSSLCFKGSTLKWQMHMQPNGDQAPVNYTLNLDLY